MDAETFKCALLNIYPRLSRVTGFTLWTLNKDKTFEKLPQKVRLNVVREREKKANFSSHIGQHTRQSEGLSGVTVHGMSHHYAHRRDFIGEKEDFFLSWNQEIIFNPLN